MYSAAIFDLDQTLVDSSKLEFLRGSSQWDEVYKRLSEVTPFEEAIGLMRLLRAVGIPCAIVTSTPRKYALELAARLRIPFDVLVTADDVTEIKPSREPVIKAIDALSLQPSNDVVFIGNSDDDVLAARAAGVSSILIDWKVETDGTCTATPDLTASSAGELARLLGLSGPTTGKPARQPSWLSGTATAHAVASIKSAEWFEWIQRELLPQLPPSVDLYVLGGSVRDAILSSGAPRHVRPRDIDIVVSGIFNGNDSFTSLRKTLPQRIPLRRTSLDASIMEDGGFVVELWCLENSFPIQLFALPPTISSLLSFVPYDMNALAFDCRNAELIGFEDYVTSLPLMTFNLHSPQLYLPALQIARLFFLEKMQGFTPTSICKCFVFRQHQERYVPFYARLLKHKGCEHLVDDLLSDVRAYA